MTRLSIFMLLVLLTLPRPAIAQAATFSPNLVANGDFEAAATPGALPEAWQMSGRREIAQTLSLDVGHTGRHAAKLACTRYVGGTPDSHVMMCQVGQVPVEPGVWYRLSFWVKGTELAKPLGEVAISNTRIWGPSGIAGQFVVDRVWRQVELFSKATHAVSADASRLQFWFHGTGTMWFDEIVLQKVDMKEQFHPAIATQDVKNLLPNSSFECGSGQWGSYSPRIATWAGNLNQQLGVIDMATAWHGRQSLRIDIDKSAAPVFHWDYFSPAVDPIHTILCANHGWIPVQRGKTYTVSAYLKASQSDVPAQWLVHHAQHGNSSKSIAVDADWRRYSHTFRANTDFIWIGVGLDLTESSLQSARLWIDALQLETGKEATQYAPRAAVESTLATAAVGNIFTQPDVGLSFDIDFCSFGSSNSGNRGSRASGKITIRDFFDRQVYAHDVSVPLSDGANRRVHMERVLAGQPGFYRVSWTPSDHRAPFQQSVRCALITPYDHQDSPFGMNHAYPWDFMLNLSRQAGLTWMRDWSAKWFTVEPEQGRWDFSKVDSQIDRVCDAGLNSLVLLPSPSASWCSGDAPVTLSLPSEVHAVDLMGNVMREDRLCVGSTPVYLRTARLATLCQTTQWIVANK